MRTFEHSSSDPASSDAGHVSVLLHESIDSLAIQPGDTVVDATLGGAGHARLIASRLGQEGTLVGFDLDEAAIERTRAALAEASCRVELIRANFRDMQKELAQSSVTRIDKVLFDLGWSGFQLAAGRGFSFLVDEPLLMTYARDITPDTLTARKAVNEWAEESLADVIYGFGEERNARRIARAICEARKRKPIETSLQLAEIVRAAVPAAYARGRIHPATKTFQALRIAVNDELGALEQGLDAAWELLTPGGRVVVISFHSIEDRLVKRVFAAWEKEGKGKRTPKKPIPPSRDEVKSNPRSRSAKLRVFEKM